MSGIGLTLRRNRLWIATATLAFVVAAASYAYVRAPLYRARAQLLVTPVAAEDPTFVGLDVMRDASGRRTAAETAARLVDSPQVADAVKNRLGTARSRDDLLAMVDAHVLGRSDVVAVDARSTRPSEAAQLANAFTDAVVAQRTALFQSNVAASVRRTQAALSSLPAAQRAGPQGIALARRLASLRTLVGTPDPTLRQASQAVAPEHAYWPKPWQTIVVAGIVGLLTGIGLALLRDLFRPGPPRLAGDAPAFERGVSERLVEQLEQRLADRIETLARREAALAVRERDVTDKVAELKGVAGEAAVAVVDEEERLREREGELEQRLKTLTRRESELARRAGELAVRERTIAEAPQAPAAEPEPVPAAPPPEPPAPVVAGDGVGRFNLNELERLVERHGAEYPQRTDDWSSYLFFLRDYADPSGSLPPSFDYLIQDTFGELLN